MEPLSTSAVIGGIVTYLAKKLGENSSINDFLSDFSKATVEWVRPFFLTEGGEEETVVEELRKNPRSEARQLALKSKMAIALEDDPTAEAHFRRMFEEMKETKLGSRIVTIMNSSNVNTGDVNTGGGDFRIGN